MYKSLKVSPETHKLIKTQAAAAGMTIDEFLVYMVVKLKVAPAKKESE